MSPEAISNPNAVDARSDLYALGAVAYYLLVGEHVFRAASMLEVCSKHLLEAPAPPSARLGRALPMALEQLVLQCLAKQPEARPQSARELLERLSRLEVAPWDTEQAEAWWREHGPSVRAVSRLPSGSGRTIEVDLGRSR
jgi:serine/threonine-protein kinase